MVVDRGYKVWVYVILLYKLCLIVNQGCQSKPVAGGNPPAVKPHYAGYCFLGTNSNEIHFV